MSSRARVGAWAARRLSPLPREGAFVLVDCDRSVDAAHATIELRPGSRGAMPSQHPCHLTDELAADTSSPVAGADFVVDSTTKVRSLFP